MKKLIITALCALTVAACGGGSKKDNPVIIDGGNGDGTTPGGACNPYTQAGCDDGQKCTDLVVATEPTLLRQTACVPDGNVAEGGACVNGAPGQDTGFDDCVGGTQCLGGICTEICTTGPPDSCPQDAAIPEVCTPFADLFDDGSGFGLCSAGCIAANDSVTVVAEGPDLIVNANCEAGEGCYPGGLTASASCAGVPGPAATVTQNKPCYGPTTGGCFLNGCAGGFGANLPNNAEGTSTGNDCTRHCKPANPHKDNLGVLAGAGDEGVANSGRCLTANLAAVGGTNGNNSKHECRHYNAFYNNTQDAPDGAGFCVPVDSLGGGSFGSCEILDWEGIKNAWNTAVAGGGDAAAANAALDQFCLVDPNAPPEEAELKEECIGLFRGCISIGEENEGLDAPAGGAFFNRAERARRYGIELPTAPAYAKPF